MELVTIRTFLNHIEADLAKGALQSAGIEAMISADDAGGTRPHLWNGTGVRLLVCESDREDAELLLAAADQ